MTDLHLSTFVAGIYAAGLDKHLKHTASTTLFAPINTAFDSLGAVWSCLLLPSSLQDLRAFIRYHFLNEVAYLSDLKGERSRYHTVEGSDLTVQKNHGNLTLSGPTVSGYPVSGQITAINVTSGDSLTATGVLHVIDSVMLPPTVYISNRKLLQGVKAETMASLIKLANMSSWLLDGEDPPTSFTKARSAIETSYTLLVPSDRAFNHVNLTYYEHNLPALKELIKLHIIPQDAQQRLKDSAFDMRGHPLSLSDGLQMDTLLSKREGGTSRYGSLAFRKMGDSFLVGIKDARGTSESNFAHIVGFGKATPRLKVDTQMLKRRGKKSLVINGGGILAVSSF